MSGGKQTEAVRPRKTANVVLVILGSFLLAFIVTMIAVYCVKGSVPDVLIEKVMDAGWIEAAILGVIKISKVISGKNDAKNNMEIES